MTRSLDGLIRHLVDRIALCGEHGALPLDFIVYVKSYYVNPIENSQIPESDNAIPPGIASNVDRPFLEQVWIWLVKNPEIRLGSHAGHQQLTLSEVEARNAAIEPSEQSIPVSHETDHPRAVTPSHGSDALTSIQDEDITQTQQTTEPAGVETITVSQEINDPKAIALSHAFNPRTSIQDDDATQTLQTTETAGAETKDAAVPQESKLNPGIRLYASENRMWHAVAGHSPDFAKIKRLDFACLSIIAACGPKGILQYDLVRISGQDKRSLPARTDRLHAGGYVVKKRVSVELRNPDRLLHTSKCTLKRFLNDNSDQKQQTSDASLTPAETRKRKKRKGQKGQDSQARGQPSTATVLESDSVDAALSRSRTVPLWTADRSINNQIFELVDRAGIKGMSMIEIRDHLMGDYVKKPLDEYVSRLVQSWQLSQPLHIRHLSIVRDTVLKGKTQIYKYYTYESFKKLVEGGTGYWEAVKTVPSEITKGKNIAAALDAEPDVDEYGFPRLEENQFQGPQNDATLEECVSALNVDPLHISANDPVVKRQADGTYGVRCKSHQQHSPTVGNRPSPTKAALTASQAALTKGRAIEPKKVALSTPFDSVSTQTQAIEPKKVADSNPPGEVQVKAPAVGLQTLRRKYLRKANSKPRGRPRKYPKTGMPANFDTMTPEGVDDLLQSQDMFEKYEIARIEKEIVRRVEEGEDAVIVAYEVLAECDESRKQEGELPLPKTSRAQVLHNFAGEPMPEADPDEAKPKGRPRKDTPYRPSVAAPNYSLPALPRQASLEPKGQGPENGSPILQTRTRRRGQPLSDLKSTIYLPSVAAHSWPHVRPPSSSLIEMSTTVAMQNNVKRKQSRSAKSKNLIDPRFKDLPSNTAHSGSFVPSETLSVARAGQKRKRITKISLGNNEEHRTLLQYKYLPSMAAHSSSFLPPDELDVVRAGPKRKRTARTLLRQDQHNAKSSIPSAATDNPLTLPPREASLGTSDIQLNAGSEGMYPGWEKFMSKYYQQQLETIPRSDAGVFIGKSALRRKRPCEPRDFRPAYFKLAVFKSIRLRDLDWYVKKNTASEQVSRPGSRTQSPTSPVAEPAPMPDKQSMSEGQPNLSRLTSLPSPAPSCLAPTQEPTSTSPYPDAAGTKRKRTASPQPTRGTAPSGPFSASPYSRQPSPTSESSNPVSKPSTLPGISELSPAIDRVHGNSVIENDTPASTPERQPDMKESSELTANTAILNDLGPTQSAIAVSRILQPSQSATQRVVKPSKGQPINKISRQGGSTAMLRKNIIMDIVNKCEGVFPSHKEMSSPFAYEWKRRGQEGTPEPKTISNAVNALINENKLRQITFASQTRQGVTVTKSMLVLPTIDTADPRVKETQKNMVAYHPRYFVPVAVLPPPENQSIEPGDTRTEGENFPDRATEETVLDSSALESGGLRRRGIGKKMMDGKERAAMARAQALKEQGEHGLGHANGDNLTTEPFVQRAPADTVHAASGRARAILPKPISKRSGGRRGQKRVERLASIKKAAPTPLPIPANPASNPGSLVWLPSDYAFSDFNFEERRPTVLMAEADNDVQIGTSEVLTPLDSSEQARQRIREMAENAARIERKQALASSTRPSLLYNTFNSSQFASSNAQSGPSFPPRQAPASKSASLKTAESRNQSFSHTRLYAGEANVNKTVRPADDLGLKERGLEEMGQLLPTSTTMRRGSLSTASSFSTETSLSRVSRLPVFAHAEGLATSHQRVVLVSFMDPVHYFYRATGTFSVTFSGFRPPRKIFAHRGTTLDPYSASLKPVEPCNSHRNSSWLPSPQESQKPEKSTFDEEVDRLLKRELEAYASNNVLVLVGWPFVNHVFPHAHETVQAAKEADMEAAKQVTVRLKDGRLITRAFPKNSDSRPRIGKSIFSTGSRGIGSAATESRIPLKRRRLTSFVEIGTQDEASQQMGLDQEHRPTKLRRVRGPREAKSLGENGEERLLTAVMVIRALTGGLDKRIDWVLVAKVFEPTYTQMFVHSRWSLTLQKYKLILPKMESDFQNIFASAYEDGTVPTIDYDHLEDYDWKWLVEWTMANVDTPTQSLPELPVARSEFDGLYSLNETSRSEINEVYEIDGFSALARRAKIAHRDPHVLPLIQKQQGPRSEDAEAFAIAKSWIRANIMTPESTYDSSAARAKLSTFPDTVIENALKQLLLDRVLTQENKGRLIPGRNYDISDFLISRLKKNLQSTHFHRAAAYKQQLDHDFEEKGFANYSDTADDGDMIVVINLHANKRITIVPIGVPMNKWGQTDGGYETRQMDKRRLNFSLELRPSPTYIYGNLLHPLPAPPSQHLQDPMAKIPLWYDIHGSLVPVMWEMTLAAVMAVLSMRPGIGAPELEKAMRPAMEVWEVQVILEWLVDVKAAKNVGQGFIVEDEWWWLALGTGENSEEYSGEDVGDRNGKGKGKEKERSREDVRDVITMELD